MKTTGTYKAIASSPRAIKKLTAIKRSLDANKIEYHEAATMLTITFQESKFSVVTQQELCMVVTANGEYVPAKERKTKQQDWYSYQGPSGSQYEYTAEDLEFLAETEALPMSEDIQLPDSIKYAYISKPVQVAV